MNYKQKLGYTVLGAVIMLIGMSVNSILSPPLVAQRNGVFDEIECYGLTVMNRNGEPAVILGSGSEGENGIILYNETGTPAASLHSADGKTLLSIMNEDGKLALLLGRLEKRNDITLFNEKGELAITSVVADGLMRMISVYHESGKEAVSMSSLPALDHNSVAVYDRAGEQVIELGSTTGLGNRINIYDAAGDISWQAR